MPIGCIIQRVLCKGVITDIKGGKEMRVGMLAVDSDYPNLALMKISRYHKERGDEVEWYNPFDWYDVLYMSKIFSFTEDWLQVIGNAGKIVKGGTGYSLASTLPAEIERMQPDYSLYPNIPSNTAYGFLTRGCPNKCKWCVVPRKEGGVKPYMDCDEIAIEGRKNLVLMDNNILAAGDYCTEQLEKIIERGYKIDFNQAIDARLVNSNNAKLLARVKWSKYIRFGCDTMAQIEQCRRAIDILKDNGFKGSFFLYCMLHGDFSECFYRVNYWRYNYGHSVVPFCQPYRDIDNPHSQIPQWQNDMARWVNKKELFFNTEFKDYQPRTGFYCKEYFN